jgi:hypothetical protein
MRKGQYQLFIGILIVVSLVVSIGLIYYFSIKLNIENNQTTSTTYSSSTTVTTKPSAITTSSTTFSTTSTVTTILSSSSTTTISTATTTTTPSQEFFLGKPAERAGFDHSFSVRRVSTFCPFAFDNPNAATHNWCNSTDEENSKTYFYSFLDPDPLPFNFTKDSLPRGFYSLSVSNNSGLHQICKINTDCGFAFNWNISSEGKNQADMVLDTINFKPGTRTGLFGFGNWIINRNGNLYAGSWNQPLITNAGVHVQISGKLLGLDSDLNSRSHFVIGTGFSNPTSGNYYEIDINIGAHGTNPTTGCCGDACSTSGCNWTDAYSTTQKYALHRVTNAGKGNTTEIFIGAQAWNLPVLNLDSGGFQTYDIDWSSIVNQMVQDGYIKVSDLVINLNDTCPRACDLQYWGIQNAFTIETQGGVSSKLSIKDYILYNFTSS